MVRSVLRRLGAVVGGAAVVLLATALPAAAHVTVNPKEANQGGFAKLAFRVPNERDKPTTKLEVAFRLSSPSRTPRTSRSPAGRSPSRRRSWTSRSRCTVRT